MAEILLSLTIIGVVAAITLPSLTGNINERTWNTQRKALYSRFTQAIALMPALNGYGTVNVTRNADTNDFEVPAADNAAETFVSSGLSKVLKINNICDSAHLTDCGLPQKITTLSGTTKIDLANITDLNGFNNMMVNFHTTVANDEHVNVSDVPNLKAAALETANGESILVYYNPYCQNDRKTLQPGTRWDPIQKYMCANFVYDLNGKKGPNTVGKDIGVITALYPSDSNVVAPMPNLRSAGQTTSPQTIGTMCSAQDEDSRGLNADEITALFYNKLLFDINYTSPWSTTTAIANGKRYNISLSFYSARRGYYEADATENLNVWCTKR